MSLDVASFEALRPHLFGVAYRMLGSAAEAEDVVQDAWLRAAAAPPALESERAWLTTVVTRLCLDRLKSARARREEYVGPWLPEPVPTSLVDLPEAPESEVIRRESVTLAFLVVLETLSPAERAAFLLREVFDVPYAEIARTLEANEPAVRQLVSRAKRRVADGRPRFAVPPERQRAIVEEFWQALRSGDAAELERRLAADVVFTADGGGRTLAATRPVAGATAVARLLGGFYAQGRALGLDAGVFTVDFADVNGEPAIVVARGARLETVFVFATDGERVTAIRAVRNPEKLAWMERRRARAVGEGEPS